MNTNKTMTMRQRMLSVLSALTLTTLAPIGLAQTQSAQGSLAPGDQQLNSGEYYDSVTLNLQAGQEVSVDLRSQAFDTYVIVVLPNGQQIENDDYNNSQSQSRVDFTAEEAGEYRVIITSYSPEETGAYDVSISGIEQHQSGQQQQQPQRQGGWGNQNQQQQPAGGMQMLMQEAGELSQNDQQAPTQQQEFYDAFPVQLNAGQRIVVDLSSNGFDSYLLVLQADTEDVVAENDDFAGSTSRSQIDFTAPAAGQYLIVVTSYQGGETGTYQLAVSGEVEQAQQEPQPEPAGKPPRNAGGPQGNSNQSVVQIAGVLENGDMQLQTEQQEFFDTYTIEVQAGQPLTVDLTSADFDTYLIILDDQGQPSENDDFEGSRNQSRIDLTPQRAGEYQVLVTSYQGGETGNYQVEITGATMQIPGMDDFEGGFEEDVEEGVEEEADDTPRWGTQDSMGQSNERPQQIQPNTPQNANRPGQTAGVANAADGIPDQLAMVPHTIRDEMHSRDAFTLSAPEGWNVQGNIVWNVNAKSQCFSFIEISNPNNGEAVHFFPQDLYNYYGPNSLLAPYARPGMRTELGGTVIGRPVQNPSDFVEQILLEMADPGSNPRITGYQPLPEVDQFYTQLQRRMGIQNMTVMSGIVRVEYTYEGRAVEEDIYISMNVGSGVPGDQTVNTNVLFGLRADVGHLDDATPLLALIANSRQVNQEHFAYVQHNVQLFNARVQQNLNMQREISRRNHEQIMANSQRAFEDRMASMDRNHEQFIHYIRDTSEFTTSDGSRVVLPNTHDQVFQRPDGTFVGVNNGAGEVPSDWTPVNQAN